MGHCLGVTNHGKVTDNSLRLYQSFTHPSAIVRLLAGAERAKEDHVVREAKPVGELKLGGLAVDFIRPIGDTNAIKIANLE